MAPRRCAEPRAGTRAQLRRAPLLCLRRNGRTRLTPLRTPRAGFETYSFYGFVTNEFADTHGWGCPCASMAGGCPPALGGASCAMNGADILNYWDVPRWNKWCAACVRAPAAALFRGRD